MPYLVDVILPEEEVHLLGGPSGAGKTRWLLHTLLRWEQGEKFLCYESHPVPWVYIAADRSCASVVRTLVGMGIDPGHVLTIPAWDRKMGENEIMDNIVKSQAKLAVWESFGSFAPDPQRSPQIKAYLRTMSGFCRDKHVTIIGIVESPKMKPYERYENPRQRISGAASWGHFSETIFLVEPDDVGQMDNPYRTLYVAPRNGPGMTISLSFDMQGCLLPVQDPTAREVAADLRKKAQNRRK